MAAPSWLSIATRRSVVRRALRVGLIVGTLLVLINHGDALLHGTLNIERVVKMLLTYVVPYSVSTYASVAAIRELERHG